MFNFNAISLLLVAATTWAKPVNQHVPSSLHVAALRIQGVSHMQAHQPVGGVVTYTAPANDWSSGSGPAIVAASATPVSFSLAQK